MGLWGLLTIVIEGPFGRPFSPTLRLPVAFSFPPPAMASPLRSSLPASTVAFVEAQMGVNLNNLSPELLEVTIER